MNLLDICDFLNWIVWLAVSVQPSYFFSYFFFQVTKEGCLAIFFYSLKALLDWIHMLVGISYDEKAFFKVFTSLCAFFNRILYYLNWWFCQTIQLCWLQATCYVFCYVLCVMYFPNSCNVNWRPLLLMINSQILWKANIYFIVSITVLLVKFLSRYAFCHKEKLFVVMSLRYIMIIVILGTLGECIWLPSHC